MAPKGGNIVISVSVLPSVRHRLFLLTGSSLCSLLLRNYSTDFSNDDTNQLREQCNVQFILTLTPPWLQVKVTKYFDFVNLDVWPVVVCVWFSSETTWPNSPMLMPIYRGNNVDLQHILHFDFRPSMTAGQGHDILWFCEFRLLPWHECWYMSGAI